MATIGKIDPKAQDADFEDVGVSQPFTADSSALTIAPQNEVSLAGGAAAIEPMNPMESLMEVFYEMRDSLATLVQIATDSFSQGRDEQRDNELEESETEGGAALAEGSDQGKGGFSFPKFEKPGPKLGLALLLGGLATIMAFGDKLVPIIAPVLKFIKEKALPFAIDAAKKAFEGIKTVFMYLYDNVWPFIKDNIIMNAVDYVKDTFQGIKDLFNDLGERFGALFSEDATWWERITSFIGIFTDIGQFFLDQFDRFTEFVANIFGVSFAPYDGLLSFIKGKLGEGFKVVVDWFSETGEFLLEGAKGIYGWITGKIDAVWTGITTWFSETGTFLSDGAKGIYEWITTKVSNVWTGITEWFSETGTFLSDGAKGIFEWVTTKVGNVWSGITEWFSTTGSFLADGATGIWDWVTGKVNGAWEVITDWFGFGSEEESGEPPFTIAGWIMDKASELWNKLTSFFSFENIGGMLPTLPNIGDAFMNMVGGMLPKTTSWIGKGLYALPGTDTLKKAAEAFAAGGSFEGGKLTMPEAVAKGVVEESDTTETESMKTDSTQAQHKEIADTLEAGGDMGGGTVVTNINNSNTKQGDNVTQDTHNYQDLSVDHSDPVAAALAARGYD